jgi:chromosome segregation ATPase
MSFLKTNPEKQLARDLEAAKTSREKLATRLVEAKATRDERRALAQRLARDAADDNALDNAETALRAAQDRCATLTAALNQTDADITALEKQVADAADLKSRTETVAEIEKLIVKLQHTGRALEGTAAALAECTARAKAYSFNASGLNSFAVRVQGEMPDAVRLISDDLRFKAAQVLNGKAAASVPASSTPTMGGLP